MSAIGQRGKWAEDQFKKWAKAQSESKIAFAHYRFPDARAGSKSYVPSDFMVVENGKPIFIEIKEVDHEYRLPVKNFSADKVARMRKFTLAGATGWVMVYFVQVKAWRIETVEFFLSPEGASWDMRNHKAMSFAEAIAEIMKA